MGHLDAVKAALLAVTLVSWAALSRAMLATDQARRLNNAGCAICFLATAGITRLTFTAVETRIQIAAFGVAAALLIGQRVAAAGSHESRIGRWACCLLGTTVGAVAMRELVHKYLERWI